MNLTEATVFVEFMLAAQNDAVTDIPGDQANDQASDQARRLLEGICSGAGSSYPLNGYNASALSEGLSQFVDDGVSDYHARRKRCGLSLAALHPAQPMLAALLADHLLPVPKIMPDFPQNASDARSTSGPEMEPVVLVDCLFQVSHDIRSLPPFHGARWNAWIRFGCERAHIRAEELVRAIFPFRSGQEHLKKGESAAVRLAIDAAGLDLLPRLVVGMRNTGAEGEFCPLNLEFIGFVDPILRKPVADGAPVEKVLRTVRRDDFAMEIALCRKFTRLRLDFLSPLRLTLPAGQKNVHMSARERLCDAKWFASAPNALGHLLGKVRFLPTQAPATEARIVESDLRWKEVRYNAERCVAVGGIVGKLSVEGELDEGSATRLVLGQYFGAGKSGRFGLGFWRIQELEAIRTLALPAV